MTAADPPSQTAYPHQITERLRFGDTDMQGHINNAVFATLFESGRVAFLYDPGHGLPPDGTQFVIAELTVRFERELMFPGDVVVASGVSRIGNTSLTLTQALFTGDERVATAHSAIVLTDMATRRSTPLPEAARSRLEALAIRA